MYIIEFRVHVKKKLLFHLGVVKWGGLTVDVMRRRGLKWETYVK